MSADRPARGRATHLDDGRAVAQALAPCLGGDAREALAFFFCTRLGSLATPSVAAAVRLGTASSPS